MRNVLIGLTLLCLALLFGGIGGVVVLYQRAQNTPLIMTEAVTLEIDKGDSLNAIIDKLSGQGVRFQPLWFKVLALEKQVATQLKTGEYELSVGMTLPQIIDLLAQGKTKQYSITFVEGLRFAEVLQTINANPHLSHTLSDAKRVSDFIAELNTSYSDPEGLFFPDTYFFTKQTSDRALLKRAYEKMQDILLTQWLGRADNLPLKTPYEALILASIIEKETADPQERPQIAGVFTRRLQQEMLLQTDPTVIYGMGNSYQGNITAQDLTTPTPYNTYVNKGLPPTPIALPSKASLIAALHPAQGSSLYFVARGNGKHQFSDNLNAHHHAVNQLQLEPPTPPLITKPKRLIVKNKAKRIKTRRH